MKRLILIGRSGAGKTTLAQALRGEAVCYKKTQYVSYSDVIIDTPGEYLQTAGLGAALALYSYEADVAGLLAAATEPYSLYPPNITCMVNRDVIGIVTQIDRPEGNAGQAENWLRLAGCKTIFHVNAKSGEGIAELLGYLREPGEEGTPV